MTPANSNDPTLVRPTIWRGVLWATPASVLIWAVLFKLVGLL